MSVGLEHQCASVLVSKHQRNFPRRKPVRQGHTSHVMSQRVRVAQADSQTDGEFAHDPPNFLKLVIEAVLPHPDGPRPRATGRFPAASKKIDRLGQERNKNFSPPFHHAAVPGGIEVYFFPAQEGGTCDAKGRIRHLGNELPALFVLGETHRQEICRQLRRRDFDSTRRNHLKRNTLALLPDHLTNPAPIQAVADKLSNEPTQLVGGRNMPVASVCPPNLDGAKIFPIGTKPIENASAGAQIPDRVERRKRGVLDKIIQCHPQTRSRTLQNLKMFWGRWVSPRNFWVTSTANKPLQGGASFFPITGS